MRGDFYEDKLLSLAGDNGMLVPFPLVAALQYRHLLQSCAAVSQNHQFVDTSKPSIA
jgi:hypothetical protein